MRTLVTLLCITGSAAGQVRMSTKQALALAFPGCKIERTSCAIKKPQQQRIAKRTGQPFRKALVFAYVARKKGKLVGTAYFDVHKVRSKKQLLMVALTPRHTVHRVEVLAFAEPKKYAAPRQWLRKFPGHKQVRVGHEVPRITGATLTVQATAGCVQRTLAMHAVLFPERPHKGPKRK